MSHNQTLAELKRICQYTAKPFHLNVFLGTTIQKTKEKECSFLKKRTKKLLYFGWCGCKI